MIGVANLILWSIQLEKIFLPERLEADIVLQSEQAGQDQMLLFYGTALEDRHRS
jgi:hypothetical protein